MKIPRHFAAVRGLIPIVPVLAAGKIMAADYVTANTSSAPINDSIDRDPLVGFSHCVAGDPIFTAATIRPLTAGFAAFYRF